MLIIEGPDRAGKTTLANYVQGLHGSDIRHLAGSFVRENRVIRHWGLVEGEFWQYEKTGNRNVVYDRMVLGSIVYEFKRDDHNLLPVTDAELGEWLTWLAVTGSVLVCCLPPLRVLLERMTVGETYITRDEMIKVWGRYNVLFQRISQPMPFPVLTYDSNRMSPDQFYAANESTLKAGLGVTTTELKQPTAGVNH